MPDNKILAAFYLASAVILYCAYVTLIPDLPNPAHYAKRIAK